MPLPVLPTVFRCAITHSIPSSSHSFNNVIHVSSSTLTVDQVATAVNGAIAVGTFDAKFSAFSAQSIVITKLDGVSPSFEGPLTGAGFAGTGTLEYSPASAVVVTLKTSQRGRRHTGRVYIGGIAEDKILNGTLLPASLATMQAAWTTTIANLISAGVPLNVTSYGHTQDPDDPNDTTPTFPPTTVLVTFATVQNVLGTQRRRQSRLRI